MTVVTLWSRRFWHCIECGKLWMHVNPLPPHELDKEFETFIGGKDDKQLSYLHVCREDKSGHKQRGGIFEGTQHVWDP